MNFIEQLELINADEEENRLYKEENLSYQNIEEGKNNAIALHNQLLENIVSKLREGNYKTSSLGKYIRVKGQLSDLNTYIHGEKKESYAAFMENLAQLSLRDGIVVDYRLDGDQDFKTRTLNPLKAKQELLFSSPQSLYPELFIYGKVIVPSVKSEIKKDSANKASFESHSGSNKSDIDDILYEIDQMDGIEFEQFCSMLLHANGYSNVQMTKTSGDQGADIIMERDGVKYAVQCKRLNSVVGNSAVQEVFSGKNYYHCHVGVVLTNSDYSSSAIELATNNGIVLWGRKDLINLISNSSMLQTEIIDRPSSPITPPVPSKSLEKGAESYLNVFLYNHGVGSLLSYQENAISGIDTIIKSNVNDEIKVLKLDELSQQLKNDFESVLWKVSEQYCSLTVKSELFSVREEIMRYLNQSRH